MLVLEKGEPCVGLSEVQAYARVETGEEEAMLAGLLRVASEMCESFLGMALMQREFREVGASDGGQVGLEVRPVRLISSVRKLDSDPDAPSAPFEAVISADGRAVLSGLQSGVIWDVRGVAGLAAEPNEVPEPIRQGILRLCVHLFANRDGPAGDLPRAVTALWRPYRLMGLAR